MTTYSFPLLETLKIKLQTEPQVVIGNDQKQCVPRPRRRERRQHVSAHTTTRQCDGQNADGARALLLSDPGLGGHVGKHAAHVR